MPAPNRRAEVNDGYVVPRNPDSDRFAIVTVFGHPELEHGMSLRSRKGRHSYSPETRAAGPTGGATSAGAGA